MARKTPPKSPDSLERLARAIPEPRHYYTGVEPPFRALPVNILLFTRRSRREFLAYHTRLSSHPRHVLVVPLRTPGIAQIGELFLPLSPGEAIVVRPFQLHRFFRFERDSLFWFYATFELESGESLASIRGRQLHVPSCVWGLLREMTSCFLRRIGGQISPVDRNRVSLSLAAVLNELLHEPRNSGLRAASTPKAQRPPLVSEACRLIDERLASGARVSEIAGALGVSESHLRSLFRTTIGQPVGRYLRDARVLRASELIALSDMPLGRIARECGFDSVYSFSRTFRNQVGMPPREYRKRRAGVVP